MQVTLEKPFDLKTWDGFSDLPKEGMDYLLDTTALNKKLRDKAKSPYRMRTGSFLVAKGISGDFFKRDCDNAIKKWLVVFEKQGWTLASKVQVYGPYIGYDISLGAVLLDKQEIRVRAVFKTNPKPIRIELPPSSIRQDPEQKASLSQVARGEGMRPIPRNKRPQQ